MARPRSQEGRAAREAILEFIAAFKAAHGYCPNQREIQQGLGLSKGNTQWHLGSLRDQGFITYQPHDFARTLHLTRKNRKTLT